MTERTSPTFRRRRLARRIREIREQSGMTQGEDAAGLDMSKSALSRKEIGETVTSVHEVRSMMDLYDVYDSELIELARAAREKGWWRAYGIEDRGYVDLETEACTVRDFQVTNVPGLLQTEDYARALFSTANRHRSTRWVENKVAARAVRRERLVSDERPLELIAVVDESALRREVGGRAVMRAQLAHLVKHVELATVTLRVMPLSHGAHASLEGAFTVLSFPELEDPEVLCIEHVAGAVHTEKPAEVRAARVAFDGLLGQALDPAASVELVDRLRREW